MEIYIIMEHEKYSDSSRVHSAYVSESEANSKAQELNKEEELKEQKYNEWLDRKETDEDEQSLEWGDKFYMVTKTILHSEENKEYPTKPQQLKFKSQEQIFEERRNDRVQKLDEINKKYKK